MDISDSSRLAFNLIQIGNYAIAVYVLTSAWKRERPMAIIMLAAMIYGYLVEYSQVTQSVAILLFPDQPVVVPYSYPFALVMLPGPVPLGICLSWGIVIFAAMKTASLLVPVAEQAGIGGFILRSMIAGFLAVSIDLALDPSLVKLGFWVWHTEPQLWFGVPWNNFIAWFVIVSCFSFVQAFGHYRFARGRVFDFVIAGLALIPAFILFVILMVAWVVLAEQFSETLLVAAFFGLCLAVVLLHFLGFRRNHDFEFYVVLGPFYLYLWSLIAIIVTRLDRDFPTFVLVAPLLCLIGVAVFLWPYSERWLSHQEIRRHD